MTYELPTSLSRYGAELEAAIRDDLGRRQSSQLRTVGPLRLRIRTAVVVGLVAVVGLVVALDTGGAPLVTPAYASFTGAPGAFANTIHIGTGATITARTSFAWTSGDMTMTMTRHWIKRPPHQRAVTQVRRWYAHRTMPLAGGFQMPLHPTQGAITRFPSSTIRGTEFIAAGGTANERGTTVTIRLLQPVLNGYHPFKYIQVHTPGKTLTFTVSRSTEWRTDPIR